MSQLFCLVGAGLIVGSFIMVLARYNGESAGQVIRLLVAAVFVGGIIIWFSLNGGLPGPPARQNVDMLKWVMGLAGGILLLCGFGAFFIGATSGDRDSGKVGCVGTILCFGIGGLLIWLAYG